MRARHSVNEGFGEEVYRKHGHSVNHQTLKTESALHHAQLLWQVEVHFRHFFQPFFPHFRSGAIFHHFPIFPHFWRSARIPIHPSCSSPPHLDGRNRAIVIAESLARVIAAIRITSACWRSYLALKTQNLVLIDPAFVALRFESRDWGSLVWYSFHVELRNGLREFNSVDCVR